MSEASLSGPLTHAPLDFFALNWPGRLCLPILDIVASGHPLIEYARLARGQAHGRARASGVGAPLLMSAASGDRPCARPCRAARSARHALE